MVRNKTHAARPENRPVVFHYATQIEPRAGEYSNTRSISAVAASRDIGAWPDCLPGLGSRNHSLTTPKSRSIRLNKPGEYSLGLLEAAKLERCRLINFAGFLPPQMGENNRTETQSGGIAFDRQTTDARAGAEIRFQ
jgi:hypothetical protein